MKITRSQLKQIIIESLEDYEAMYDRGASPEEIARLYNDKEADKRAEYIAVYEAIVDLMDDSYLDDDEKNKIENVLLDLLGIAGIAL